MNATKCKPVVFWWNEVKPLIICDHNGNPHMWVEKRLYAREELIWESHFNPDRPLIIKKIPIIMSSPSKEQGKNIRPTFWQNNLRHSFLKSLRLFIYSVKWKKLGQHIILAKEDLVWVFWLKLFRWLNKTILYMVWYIRIKTIKNILHLKLIFLTKEVAQGTSWPWLISFWSYRSDCLFLWFIYLKRKIHILGFSAAKYFLGSESTPIQWTEHMK